MEFTNVSILQYKDVIQDGDVVITRKALEEIETNTFHNLPVYFIRGATKTQIGVIHKVRRGRDEVFADVILDLKGFMELKKDDQGKLKALFFGYKKEG